MKSERESKRRAQGDAIDPDKTVQVRRRESIDAHAMDLGAGPDSTLETRLSAANARRKRLSWFVAAAVAISAVILLVGLGRRAMAAAAEERQPVLSSVTVVGARVHDAPSAPNGIDVGIARPSQAPPQLGGVPSVDVASLPVASTGRLLGAHGRRVVVDGAVVSGNPAIVQCGKRVVKVGRRKPRVIDVPCGGDVNLR